MIAEDQERPKVKHPRAAAIAVARELCHILVPAAVTDRLKVAGSLRRMRREVGDIEIVYVARLSAQPNPESLFGDELHDVDLMEVAIASLLARGILAKRENKLGRVTWGPQNKLAVHVASGIPVDLFSTEEASWWNYLVCRTGVAESNVAIAAAAKERGWKWNPYGAGFSRGGPLTGRPFEERTMRSEEEVFQFVGLPYLQPEERE